MNYHDKRESLRKLSRQQVSLFCYDCSSLALPLLDNKAFNDAALQVKDCVIGRTSGEWLLATYNELRKITEVASRVGADAVSGSLLVAAGNRKRAVNRAAIVLQQVSYNGNSGKINWFYAGMTANLADLPVTPDIKMLAESYYATEDVGVLPILADALEEEGYNAGNFLRAIMPAIS